ncbi:MAG: transcriptional regulator [Nitrosomonadales bacterium]|nr:transcriptional regulator [Nitrosomonadales bacterium]
MESLDPLLHQPLRTQLAAFLAGAGEVTFTDLKRQLDVSDGNLDSHLKKLIAADYVCVRKETSGIRPQSYYALTASGQAALHTYVAALQQLLAFAPSTSTTGWSPVNVVTVK